MPAACDPGTSFHQLLTSLPIETVQVAMQGDTAANGRLVDIDPHFITVAVQQRQSSATPSHVLMVFIPIRRISAIAEL